MKQIHKDRLLKLADYLYNTVNPKNFDISWFVTNKNEIPSESSIKEIEQLLIEPDYDCGYAACAIGFMPAVFPNDFKWQVLVNNDISPRVAYVHASSDEQFYEWDNAMEFFAISRRQGKYLFLGISYPGNDEPGPKEVAERIRTFVAANGKIP